MNEVNIIKPIGKEQLLKFTQTLQKYKASKSNLEDRVKSAEDWWKLRNATKSASSMMSDGGFTAKTGWLHNVISTKHADAMEAYPEPNILPREESDKPEAKMLSTIIPCILEQNDFENTYSEAMWAKMKSGTGVYKITWDKNKLNGLGDISITPCSLLNLFWEGGIKDIQKSRYFFQTELVDKDLLEEKYPELFPDGVKGDVFTATQYTFDDKADTENKATVIECYYHKTINGKSTLQYVKYVGDVVLYATENDTEPTVDGYGNPKPPLAVTGLYEHGKYPYVFDPLYPVEGSPCGYGYVDLCQTTQQEIDILNTAFIRNARAGASPRYFARNENNISEEEFLDLSKSIVHVSDLSEIGVRPIEHKSIDGAYLNLLDRNINELRETSGNTETSTGSVPSGVTSGAAIAALQSASGKGSKDSTQASYRKYGEIVTLCIELIRQFYDLPRKFRVLGQYGTEQYITYTNQNLKGQGQNAFGQDMGLRLPVFDVKVSAQTKNVYTKISQNELALQFFQLGFCNPQMADQALMCLDMMDFDGKDGVMQKLSQNGTMFDKLQQYMQLSLMLSQVAAPQYTEQIAMDMQMMTGTAPQVSTMPVNLEEGDNIGKGITEEPPTVEKARERAESASQPV